MRLYIQEKSNLLRFNLPAKVDGSMIFSFKSNSNGLDNSINVDAVDNEWVLKSNGNINILGSNNNIIPEIKLSNYMCVPVSITGIPNYLCIFCLPSIEEYQFVYNIDRLNSITIGSGANNNIVYQQNMMAEQHAVLKLENDNWYICPVASNADTFIYVNNQRVFSPTLIYAGDIIFMNGLRIIWMKKSFIIPMTNDLFRVNGINYFDASNFTNNTEYTPVSELDSNISLYNENDYFSHTPRIRSVLELEEVKIDPPPGRQDNESETPFLLSIGSSFTMLGMMSLNIISLYDGIVSGEKDFIELLPRIIMIVSMLIGSFLIPLVTKKWQKILGEKREKKRQEKYGEYLLKKEQEIEAKKKKHEQIVLENNIDLSTCLQALSKRNRLLWNRTIKDDDFIELRLGVGDRPSMLKVTAPEDKFSLDDDNLYEAVCLLGKKYDKINNVPITISLKDQIVTSLIMQNSKKNEFINGLMLQLLTLQSPLDLKLVIFTDEVNSYKWNYLKYTNHNWSDDHQIRYFATNQDDYKSLSQFLDTEFIDRKEKKATKENQSNDLNKEKLEEYELYESYYLIITDSFKALRKFKFFQDLLENQYNYGFSLLIIDKDMKNMNIM